MESGINDINQKKGSARVGAAFFISNLDFGFRNADGRSELCLLRPQHSVLIFPPYHNVAFLYATL